jgi:hypothetical protein
MKTRTKKIVGVCSGVLVIYFAAYFLSVRTNYLPGMVVILPEPVYRPVDAGVVRAVFAPAHLLDATYLRPAHWEAQERR